MSTLTVATGHPLFARGDYAQMVGHKAFRVLFATSTTLTFRDAHRWRWLEWLHARCEDAGWAFTDRFTITVTDHSEKSR